MKKENSKLTSMQLHLFCQKIKFTIVLANQYSHTKKYAYK